MDKINELIDTVNKLTALNRGLFEGIKNICTLS